MKPNVLVLALGGILALVGRPADADEMTTLQQLLKENQNLSVQLDKNEKVKGDIAKAELAVKGADSALKHAEQELHQKGAGLLQQHQNIQGQVQQSGCPWGTTQQDKAFVDACNTEGARLNAMLQDVQKQGITLVEYSRKLQEERAQLSKRTMDWFDKKKSNNADLELLQTARTDWVNRYNAFVFHSETYERLKRTRPGAEICDQISATDLPGAARCLQHLFDGAAR
jgi:hypothetical protein